MYTLDLRLPSKKDVMKGQLVLAGTPAPLTPFGKFARYMFIIALEYYAVKKKNTVGVKKIKAYVARCYEMVDKSIMRGMGTPIEVLRTSMDAESVYEAYGSRLRSWYRDKIANDADIPKLEKDLYKRSLSFMSTNLETPESGLKACETLAWQISDNLGEIFNTIVRLGEGDADIDKESIAKLNTELKSVVKRITGKSAINLDGFVPSEKMKINPIFAEMRKEYNTLLKAIRSKFEAILKKETVSGPIEVTKLEAIMDNAGFEVQFFPSSKSGFVGKVGLDHGKMALFTLEDRQISGLIPPRAKVRMNKNYNPEVDDTYVMQYTAPNAVTDTRIYTMRYKGNATESKFNKVEDSAPQVGKWLATWKKDLLYTTGARVGSRTESASKKGAPATYGISTLRIEHVKVTATSIIIAYNGKKGMAQLHNVKIGTDAYLKICAATITMLKKGKKKGDLLFEFPRPTSSAGTLQAINPPFFRNYMTSCGMSIKVHALRHIRGTELVRNILAKSPWKQPKAGSSLIARQRSADDYIKMNVLTKVGALLGHAAKSKTGEQTTVWRTSITSYVNPVPIINWYKEQKLEVPKWVPMKVEADD